MNEVGNATILPLALWLKEAPTHNISALIYLRKKNLIVSGCDKGHILIWTLNENGNELTPRYYMIGHKSKITNFVLAGSSQNTNMEYFISFSGEGEIGLWEAEEGRNIEFISNSQMNIQYVFSYESVNTKQRMIFCCLKNREIMILNSMSLSHICTLVCTSSPNWFSSLSAFNRSAKEDVILATTVSGLISMWVINFTDVLVQEQPHLVVDADEYVDISTTNPFKIVHNQHCADIVMIITPSQMKIFYVQNWSILAYLDCRRGDYFIDGNFILHDCILIHTQSGVSCYYQLPVRANCQHSLFLKNVSNVCENIPMLLLEIAEPENIGLLRHKIYVETATNDVLLWKGFSNGNIYKWNFINGAIDEIPLVFNLNDIWTKINKTTASLTRSLKNSSPIGVVTSLLFIHDLSLIVLGMETGLIFIRNISDTLNNAFSECDCGPSRYISLVGHNGTVLCLCHPSSNMKLSNLMTATRHLQSKSCMNLLQLSHILWSGGKDFTIRTWNIRTSESLNIFHCHSAPVVSLKLNHLPMNSANICGFSQGFIAAMFKTITEDEENSHDIKQMINMCMNAFLVGIGDNDGISIISIAKQKLLLYTAEHVSPVRSLGWYLDSGYLLIDTVDNTVYIWDLASGTMDRYEIGQKAQLLMENCPVVNKIRSHRNNEFLNTSKSVRRHSIISVAASNSSPNQISNNKIIRFQFITSGDIYRNVPVMLFNLGSLLDSLNSNHSISATFCEMLVELDNSPSKESKKKSEERKRSISDLDFLIANAKSDKQNLNLKILLIKIILSQTNLIENFSILNSKVAKANKIACSFGQVNSKTGCIIFDVRSLFEDSSPETTLTIENLLIQLSISNKIISFSKSAQFNDFFDNYMKPNDSSDGSCLTIPACPHLSSSQKPPIITVTSFKIHRKAILKKVLPEFLQFFNGEINDMSFNLLEKICNRLIFGILDVCDTISKSSLQLLAKVINNLTDQQIQNYILVWRLFLSPNLDSYGTEDGRNFLMKIQPFFDKFLEYSYLSTDWVWWYSNDHIKSEHEKRNLSKIQIKALLNIALVGSHLLPDDYDETKNDSKLFSKLFSLDKSFLARITCDFLMAVLGKKPQNSRSSIGRLINLSMICLSYGFVVWEPYLDSNTIICQFLHYAVDLDDSDITDKSLSMVSRKATQDIAAVRPLVFIMVCYREMLRIQILSNNHNTGYSGTHSYSSKLDRRRSFPNLGDIEFQKGEKTSSLLNRHILLPIFNDLCQNQSTLILDVLPEIVELYVHLHNKEEDFTSLMLPVLKFSSVSMNVSCGQISVGSKNGFLFLFDLKIGKYFNIAAHKKSIKLTKFCDDGKLVASYCLQENMIKIWQISNVLFSLGNNSYQVKMISSHVIPNIEKMLAASKLSVNHVPADPSSEQESDLYLQWDTDNKTLFVKMNEIILRQIKL